MAKKQTPNPADAPAKVPAASDAEEAGQPKEAKKPKAQAAEGKGAYCQSLARGTRACGSRSPDDSGAARQATSERTSGGERRRRRASARPCAKTWKKASRTDSGDSAEGGQ